MFKLQRVRRGVCITLLSLVTALPLAAQAADPLTVYLLKMLRDQAVSAAIESAAESTPPAAAPEARPLEGVYGISETQLRGLIDTGFVHLNERQRRDIYDSLTRMLADPKNAAARPMIIEQLAVKAAAVRGALERLEALSTDEKRAIVVDARNEFERMSGEERERMKQLLLSRVAPIPRDLNDLMLAELRGMTPAAAPVP